MSKQPLHSHVLIEHKLLFPISFLLSDCPTEKNLPEFIQFQQNHGSSNIIRISAPESYDSTTLSSAGIKVNEFYFEDGSVPSRDLIERYFNLLNDLANNAPANTGVTIGIHCVSGIGRAPLFVCMALIERGMDRLDAVEFIRSKRRGAINKKQLEWITTKGKNGFQVPKKKGGFLSKLLGGSK